MTGYVRKDTTNNIADGNVINAADLDAEFDGVQAAFNASTGHKHDGTASEGATINALGPTQDVTISATLVAPKTTNFVDIGSSGLKFKDMFLAGNASIGGTLAVTGVATFTAQPILSSLTASRAVFSDGSKGLVSNAITGTGNVVMSASPTLTGTIGGASLTLSSLTSGRVTYAGASGLLQDSANLLFNGTTLTANTLNLTNALGTTYGGTGLTSFTANGVVYASSSSALTTGSALTFDGTTLTSRVSANATLQLALSATNATNADFNVRIANSLTDLQVSSATPLSFTLGASEQMRLTSTGLGIGTSSPAVRLDVRFATNPATDNGNGLNAIRSYVSAALAADIGGAVAFGGTSTSGGVTASFGQIAGRKENATSANYAGYLQFATNNAVGTMTEHMRIDSSGNLGLGVTPSAWGQSGTVQAIQIKSTSFAGAGTNAYWGSNWFGGGFDKYIATATASASLLVQTGGAFLFNTAGAAAAHTAGDPITFTQAMTLDASGNLGIGTSSPATKLHVNTAAAGYGITIAASSQTSITYQLGIDSNSNLAVYDTNAAAQRLVLSSSGNLGLGVTPSAWNSAYKAVEGAYGSVAFRTNAIDTEYVNNAYRNAAGAWIYKATGFAQRFLQDSDGDHIWFIAPSGTAGNAITFTQAMTLDDSGNLLVGTTSNPNSYRLNVSGNANATKYFIGSDPSTSLGSISNGTEITGYVFVNLKSSFYGGGVVMEGGYAFYSSADNACSLGTSSKRWTAVYATNGTIQTSDIKAKTDISELGLGLGFVQKLKPRQYKMKESGNWTKGEEETVVDDSGNTITRIKSGTSKPIPGKRTHCGFIAQEVKSCLDEEGVDLALWINGDNDVQGLRYEEFVPVLVKAIQEQQAIIQSLTDRITQLENKL